MEIRVRAGALMIVMVVLLSLIATAAPAFAASQLTISKATATEVLPTSAVIEWRTNRSADSWVVVPGQPAVGDRKTGTEHSVELKDLKPGTTYSVSVRSADKTSTTSTTVTFTTPAGMFYVLRCTPRCAATLGHTAVLYYDGANGNYTFLSWEADENTFNWKTGRAVARMRKVTLTGALQTVLKSDKIQYWEYKDYKEYSLDTTQLEGLRKFVRESQFTSAVPPIYDLYYRNCAHFTWSAMLAAGITPPVNYGDRGYHTPDAWFNKLTGSKKTIKR